LRAGSSSVASTKKQFASFFVAMQRWACGPHGPHEKRELWCYEKLRTLCDHLPSYQRSAMLGVRAQWLADVRRQSSAAITISTVVSAVHCTSRFFKLNHPVGIRDALERSRPWEVFMPAVTLLQRYCWSPEEIPRLWRMEWTQAGERTSSASSAHHHVVVNRGDCTGLLVEGWQRDEACEADGAYVERSVVSQGGGEGEQDDEEEEEEDEEEEQEDGDLQGCGNLEMWQPAVKWLEARLCASLSP